MVQYTPSSAMGIAPSTTTMYLPFSSFTTRSSVALAFAPAPAMITSWYSQERRSRTTSATSGWLDRSMDSEHPVQSWNWSQTSTGFFALPTAATVCAR